MININEQEDLGQIKLITKEQYETLYKVSKILNSAVYESTLVKSILDLVIKVINAERGLVVKFDEENNNFTIIAARNVQQETISDLSEFSSGVLQKVIDNKEPCLYHDVQNDPNVSQFVSLQLYNIKSIIGVPIIRNDKIWGVILADSRANRKEFTDENLLFLDFFSNIVSPALDKIIQLSELQDENLILKNQIESAKTIPELIGNSSVMKNLAALIHKVAKTDATVLLLGESGTGKEIVANAIHYLSSRVNRPYLAQFCGSIPDTLLESELFGYKKGAFTGATSDKKGLFEVANSGTFFLDEIADISIALQAKLLRVLQNKEIIKIGDTHAKQVDVRIIAATNKDLKELVNDGKFREDLFYRLNVFPINLPSLKERRGDIPLLTKYFINKYSDKDIQISSQALKELELYDWPGNVRQLENIIQRALILCDSNKLQPEHIVIEDGSDGVNFNGTLKEIEKLLLKKRLNEFEGNRTLTAKSLGVSVRWVQLKLKEMDEVL
jgi:Nif-specific regulatory protein